MENRKSPAVPQDPLPIRSHQYPSVSKATFTTYKVREHISLKYTYTKQQLSPLFIFPENYQRMERSAFRSSPATLSNLSRMSSSPYNNSAGYSTAYRSVGSHAPTVSSLRMLILFYSALSVSASIFICMCYYLITYILEEPPAVCWRTLPCTGVFNPLKFVK